MLTNNMSLGMECLPLYDCHSDLFIVLFSDGDEVITRDHAIHQLFFLLRGRLVQATSKKFALYCAL